MVGSLLRRLEQVVPKNGIMIVIGWLASTIVFSIVYGTSEYLSALSSSTAVITDGRVHILTPMELLSDFLIDDTIRALPYGAGVSGILLVPLLLSARKLRATQGAEAYLLGIIAGVFAGGILSFVTWFMLGGWGPPFLFPACAAGIVLSLLLNNSCRRMKPIGSIKSLA